MKNVLLQIPDKVLEHRPRKTVQDGESSPPQSRPSDDESGNYIIHDTTSHARGGQQNGKLGSASRPRRLSMYEDGDAVMDPESGKAPNSSTYRRNIARV